MHTEQQKELTRISEATTTITIRPYSPLIPQRLPNQRQKRKAARQNPHLYKKRK